MDTGKKTITKLRKHNTRDKKNKHIKKNTV